MNKCQVSPDVAFILQAAFLGCYGACHIAYDQNIVGQAPAAGCSSFVGPHLVEALQGRPEPLGPHMLAIGFASQ